MVEVKRILSDISIYSGAILGVFKAIDWVIPERHKSLVKDALESIWLWLDDQRMGKFLILLRRYWFQVFFFILSQLITTSVLFTSPELTLALYGFSLQEIREVFSEKGIELLAGTLVIMIIGFLLYRSLFIWFTEKNPPSTFNYFYRLTNATFISHIYLHCLKSHSLASILSPIIFSWWFSSTWFLFIIVLMVITIVLKYIVLKIAEYPKGPIMGLSLLLISIGIMFSLVD